MKSEALAPDLDHDDRVVVENWIEAVRARPGVCPAGLAEVQSRLIRSVARGTLPSGRPAFVKWMHFPRLKDRLRYWLRALPAAREAANLDAVRRRLGERLPTPTVLALHSERRLSLPRRSVLITEALPVQHGARVDFRSAVRTAAALLGAGIVHHDLHSENFVPLVDGRVAVLDLQSVSLRSGDPGPRTRLRAAVKLCQEVWEDFDPDALVESGLISGSELPLLIAMVEAQRLQNLRRRLLRCFRESSEFESRRRLLSVEHWHRGLARAARRSVREGPGSGGGAVVQAGVRVARARLRRLWLGDRIRSLCLGEPPLLAGVRRSTTGLSPSTVYIYGDDGVGRIDEVSPILLDAYARCFDESGRMRSLEELRARGIDVDQLR